MLIRIAVFIITLSLPTYILSADNTSPATADLISPSGNITDTTPTYQWNAVADASWYYLWVNDSTGNKIKKWYTAAEVGCPNGSGTCSVTSTTVLKQGMGKWWILTWNSTGYGNWSSALQFNTASEALPVAASLVSPNGNITKATPTYQWNAVSNATWYYLWVNDSTGNKIKKWYTAEEVGCSSGVDRCSITSKTALNAGSAKWWIQTWNSTGYGPWSTASLFMLDSSNIPVAASLILPKGEIADTTPTYQWNAVANATWYYLWVNDSTGNRIKKWYTAEQVGCNSGTGICSITSTEVLKQGTGQWWVRTWSRSGYGPWSSALTYLVKTVAAIDNATAIRFLNKATFGATEASIEALQTKGVEKWLDDQLALPLSDNIYLTKTIQLAKKADPENNPESISTYLADNEQVFNKEAAAFHVARYRMSAWFDRALASEDQLRHKLTYALSQIIVVSDFEATFKRRAEALAVHFDILQRHAFGHYGDLLNEVSLSAGMGVFLTFNGSKKKYINTANVTVYPDENYARELMQLFSLGLNELNLDGTAKKDNNGNIIPTYSQDDVNELARVFTGWDLKKNNYYGQVGSKRGDYTEPLEFTASYHDNEAKTLLGETIASGLGGGEEVQRVISILMANTNVAPYISRHLIMRLAKSNPTPAYVQRVASVFQSSNGDLKKVTKAILLDQELWDNLNEKQLVKFKEPVIAYTAFLRAFKVTVLPTWYYCGSKSPTDDQASNCKKVNNEFLFNDTREFLGQGAGFAPNVFNFYDNSFIPNDSAFKESNTVAPELQIQSDTVLIKLSNKINDTLHSWEKNYLLNTFWGKDKRRFNSINDYIENSPKTESYATPLRHIGIDKMLLNVKEELDVMEMVIDGDTNGNFSNLQDYRVSSYIDDERAVDALVSHLNQKLTGGRLSIEKEAAIANNLKAKVFNKYSVSDQTDLKYDKKNQILKNVIFPAIRTIVTSNVNMTE
jgi:uncharacterized protein (DUF1800 family)